MILPIIFFVVSCISPNQATIPTGTDITIDGYLTEKAWEQAYTYKASNSSYTVKALQDDEWVYLAIPIPSHVDMPEVDSLVNKRLAFTEVYLKTKDKTIVLHASSMNGQKDFKSKNDFEWKDYPTWKANSEGKRVDGKVVYCEAYEYRIAKSILPEGQVEIIASILPFFGGAFAKQFIPAQPKEDQLNQWITMDL